MTARIRHGLKLATRAGCTAADVHLTCSYPTCSCRSMAPATAAAVVAFLRSLPAKDASTEPYDKRTLGCKPGAGDGLLYYDPVKLAQAVEDA